MSQVQTVKAAPSALDGAITVALLVIGLLTAAGAMLRYVKLDFPAALDETTLLYLVVAAGLVLFRDVKSLAFGEAKIELGRLRSEIAATQDQIAQVADSVPAAADFGTGGKSPSPRAGAALGVRAEPDGDPQKGLWGGRAARDGRRLSASVTRLPGKSEDWFRVALEVRSTDPSRPLEGDVTFHLHPTFRKADSTRPSRKGVARLTVVAWGAFTVGAEADGGKTQLELDLSEVEKAPEDFRSR